ncbi:hypothetical protein OESDEN_09743 [Oesophagostomum dentatum]|uniref:BPTI/Kunitz inhibitor domain-containing protein n=1 Tax=Oesophagostomum dentatum TaxID=61180 RepID=A0A0B1T2M8_OESDE|nr:hypothetical protein OESDEN_09743 [Oesophagostomum dentatum]
MCLPYSYSGCGGGSNSFGMLRDCLLQCQKADASYCSGGVKSLRPCSPSMTCPAGSSCHMSATKSGVCCSDRNEAEWRAAINPKCAKGSVLKIRTAGGLQILLGRSCQHKFCPLGFECVQGKYLAHCCAPDENVELVGQ